MRSARSCKTPPQLTFAWTVGRASVFFGPMHGITGICPMMYGQ
jgi:hypothetical protein